MKEKTHKDLTEPKSQYFSFDLINQYAEFKLASQEFKLSEKTLVDLDFNSYFEFIDRTSSAVGQQVLYHNLICQSIDTKYLNDQEELISYFNEHTDQKIQCQSILKKLSKPNDYYFPHLMFAELPKRLYNNWLINFLQIATFASIGFAFIHPASLILTTLLFTINLFLHYSHKNRIGNFTTYFSRLANLSGTLRKALPLCNYSEEQKSVLLKDAKHIDQITSKILFLKTDNLMNSDFGSFIWFVLELIKVLTLSEITVFNKLVDKIRSSRTQIENVFVAIGKIDIALSIAYLRDSLPYYSIPNFQQYGKELKFKKMYHPLIPDCVENDIELIGKSLLLTGSNMAGKSTFIKAVNLNALNAQVLHTSFSESYSAPIWTLSTSMTIKDNLNEKSSYYMEEVNSIGHLIECSTNTEKVYLFTIDELFKGTNTIERISTAKSILEHLNQSHHMVLVSTHDVELTKLLQKGFDLYYFQEGITDEALSFDYKIKKGTLDKSNAINILEIVGYPKSITEEAKRLALKLRIEKTGPSV